MSETKSTDHKPYVAAETSMLEFTIKAIVLGAAFGIIFGAATVYLALKAGLTVSASIPIAVVAIALGRKLFRTTILENNIIQTIGSAGESIAAGVVFTLPGLLFLSELEPGKGSVGMPYFNYVTIFILALTGGILGTLMMVPLRRSLIVKEHGNLPYPEGTACASVLIAGEKGGNFARTAFQGVGLAFAYAVLQKILKVIAETPTYILDIKNKYLPAGGVMGEITPEYLGVGYIIGPRIAGQLVAGGVLASLGLIPLLAALLPPEVIAAQQVKLSYLEDLMTAGGKGGWDPANQQFANSWAAIYYAYIRQIGAGAVAAGGLIVLIKTLPTIVASFRESLGALQDRAGGGGAKRTDRDLSIGTVVLGSIGLVVVLALLPQIPGETLSSKLLLGALMVLFGFFFVTVSSRIVGIIGTSSNPISGMTIATLMATCLVFVGLGWSDKSFEPMALVVGSIVCIAAANAGATSQDLKTGFLVGATPKFQQIGLFVGAIASALVIGATLMLLDTPTSEMRAEGLEHAIGSSQYPAPQGTLMATLIKGLLSWNLDWQFVMVGAFISITMELCGVRALSVAVGIYLPISTTLPIFFGGCLRWWAERNNKRAAMADARRQAGFDAERWQQEYAKKMEAEADLGSGNLFATGLVAGGALAGVLVALLGSIQSVKEQVAEVSLEKPLADALGHGGFDLLGVACFVAMAWVLYRVARRPMVGSNPIPGPHPR